MLRLNGSILWLLTFVLQAARLLFKPTVCSVGSRYGGQIDHKKNRAGKSGD